jgi:hypothetical protein
MFIFSRREQQQDEYPAASYAIETVAGLGAHYKDGAILRISIHLSVKLPSKGLGHFSKT